MTRQHLTVQDVANLLGRTADWVFRNHDDLIRREKFPRPILATGKIIWSTHQVYAWLDRGLSPLLRRQTAALRLAEDLLEAGPAESELVAARKRLDERFGRASP